MLIETLLKAANRDDPQCVVHLVENILSAAAAAGASDVHFHPTQHGLQLKWRIDGVLQPLGTVPQDIAANVVVRLKVLARLLTYETRLPQEGRIVDPRKTRDIRISSFPTIFGEKIVARLLTPGASPRATLAELNLPEPVADSLTAALSKSTGMILIVGPAGSGKTTTAYACLREILEQGHGQRNIVSMEDPVEVVVDGVAQAEVSESAGLDLITGLRSLVRQDPDVIFVGELRDPATASIAYQAALTGQLVITTFHASDAATAVGRLLDMEIPPYVIRSATNLIVAQRLLRNLCTCAESITDVDGKPHRQSRGCERCQHTGYQGRRLVAESLWLEGTQVNQAIRTGIDTNQLRELAMQEGMRTLHQEALALRAAGITSDAELIRVFGLNFDEDN